MPLQVYKPTVRSRFFIVEVDQYGNIQRYIAASISNQKDADDLVSAYNRAEAAEARAAQAEQERDELRRQLDLANGHAKRIMDERDNLLLQLEQARDLIERAVHAYEETDYAEPIDQREWLVAYGKVHS